MNSDYGVCCNCCPTVTIKPIEQADLENLHPITIGEIYRYYSNNPQQLPETNP